MILEVCERWIKTKRYKKKGKLSYVAIVKCDVCKEVEYELPAYYAEMKLFHVCSDKCDSNARKKDGIIYNHNISSNLEKYNVKFLSQREDIKSKIKETNLKRYGVTVTSKNADVELKRMMTCYEKYGGPAATSDDKIVKKAQETTQIRYGGPVLLNEKIRNQVCNTMMIRYGVEWAPQSSIIREKQKQTCLDRYGVEYPFHTSEAKINCQNKEAKQKRHQTKKRNGSYGKSNSEDAYYVWLCDQFGSENIERHVLVNGWDIDFYVKPWDVYVQHDGVYYHGLDRPIEVIKEFKTETDKVIYGTYLRDQEQNEWFFKNGLKLIRVTDKELQGKV